MAVTSLTSKRMRGMRFEMCHIRTAVSLAIVLCAPMLEAQEPTASGPTVVAARVAFFTPSVESDGHAVGPDASASCGSALKNATMLGIGLSLTAIILELTYTIVREPLVRRGHDIPRADPSLIAWAGGAGFVLGLIGTELCQRRRR